MSEVATKETEKGTDSIVAPFGVEADHPRNSDLLLQSVPGARLRSAIDGSKSIIDAKNGDTYVPVDQSRYLSAFPKTPGMQIHVFPAKFEYAIIDPLADDEATCERIKRFMSQHGQGVNNIKGVPLQTGRLDMHRMKTLCRELIWLLDAKEAKMVEGPKPNMRAVDKLPGHYLLNPGSRVQNMQPVYEHQYDEWLSNLRRSGD